jgi:hypothetical protein
VLGLVLNRCLWKGNHTSVPANSLIRILADLIFQENVGSRNFVGTFPVWKWRIN